MGCMARPGTASWGQVLGLLLPIQSVVSYISQWIKSCIFYCSKLPYKELIEVDVQNTAGKSNKFGIFSLTKVKETAFIILVHWFMIRNTPAIQNIPHNLFRDLLQAVYTEQFLLKLMRFSDRITLSLLLKDPILYILCFSSTALSI